MPEQGSRSRAETEDPGAAFVYRFLGAFGVCDSALAATRLSAGVDLGSLNTLPAALAARGPVCRVFVLRAIGFSTCRTNARFPLDR
jgi:hypothetical protein